MFVSCFKAAKIPFKELLILSNSIKSCYENQIYESTVPYINSPFKGLGMRRARTGCFVLFFSSPAMQNNQAVSPG